MFSMMKWAALTIGILLLPVGYIVTYEALSIVLPPVIYTAASVAIVILILGGIGSSIIGVEMVRTRIAQLGGRRVEFAAQAQMALTLTQQAKVMVITAPHGHQLAVRDNDPNSEYRLLHLPWTRVNGTVGTPTNTEMDAYHSYNGRSQPSTTAETIMIEAPKEDTLPLLPALSHANNMLIVGGTQTGKTTLMQWIEAERIVSQQIVIIDSHAKPVQWQGRMVGLGRDYELIAGEMQRSVRELDRRYKSRTEGDETYQEVTTFIDEFTLLPWTLKDMYSYETKLYSRPLLTEGQKVRMNCIWGSHSDRAEPLGLEGAADLKDCFDVIIYLKNVKGARYAICDFGEGKEDVKYILPGPFVSPPIRQAPPQPPKPTPDERKILVAWWGIRNDPDFSGSKLYRAVTSGDGRPNAKQLEKYRALLRKFNQNPNF